MTLFQQLDRFVDPTFLDPQRCEHSERDSFDPLVSERTRPAEVFLVQRQTALAVAEVLVGPRQMTGRDKREMVLVVLSEPLQARLPKIARPRHVVLGNDRAEHELGMGDSATVPE